MWKETFDKIYLLTCEKTKERVDGFLNSIPFDPKLVEIYDNKVKLKDIVIKHPKHKQYKGILTSIGHNNIIKKALDEGYSRILIFEDDARFKNISPDLIIKILTWIQNNDWDVFFLGRYQGVIQFHVNNYIVRTFGAGGAHAWCLNKKTMKMLLKNNYGSVYNTPLSMVFEPNGCNPNDEICETSTVDEFIFKEARNLKLYACTPVVFYQSIRPLHIIEMQDKYKILPQTRIEYLDDTMSDISTCISYGIIIIIMIIVIFMFLKIYKNKNYLTYTTCVKIKKKILNSKRLFGYNIIKS
jgi:hypothetical protein